jgi:hypothetical protein
LNQYYLSAIVDFKLQATSVIAYTDMFLNCRSLVDLSTVTITNNNKRNSIRLNRMFANCYNLKFGPTIYLAPQTDKETTYASYLMTQMFVNCTNLITVNFLIGENSNIGISNAESMFENCSSLIEIPSALINIDNRKFYVS